MKTNTSLILLAALLMQPLAGFAVAPPPIETDIEEVAERVIESGDREDRFNLLFRALNELDNPKATPEKKAKARKVANLMLDMRVDVSPYDKEAGRNLLMEMAHYQHGKEGLELLLSRRKFDINAADKYGYTALLDAAMTCQRDRFGGVQLLLEKGADPHARTKEGLTVLMGVVRLGAPEAAQLVIDQGVDLHATDNKGRTALHEAARRGMPETIKLLVSKGLDINVRDNEGRTPLHSCMEYYGRNAAVLIDLGADVNAKDNAGHTPLWDLLYRDKPGTIPSLYEEEKAAALKLLKEHGALCG